MTARVILLVDESDYLIRLTVKKPFRGFSLTCIPAGTASIVSLRSSLLK